MRTTLDLDATLIRRAKRRAADEGTTLTALIEGALREYLAPARAAGEAFRLKLLTRKGRPVPGVNLADRDSLYERMEGPGDRSRHERFVDASPYRAPADLEREVDALRRAGLS
jgi:Bacterial antitoxin of type II TA system, VapB